MTSKLKKTIFCSMIFLVVAGAGFYAQMEDYQKENMSRLMSQTLYCSSCSANAKSGKAIYTLKI